MNPNNCLSVLNTRKMIGIACHAVDFEAHAHADMERGWARMGV
jgi:hypothetical protein